MNHDGLKQRGARSRSAGKLPVRVRELAEAGAGGAALSSKQVREICEALHSHVQSVRNQFHSGQ